MAFETENEHGRIVGQAKADTLQPERAASMAAPLQIGLVIFPEGDPARHDRAAAGVRQVPGAKVHLIWKRIEPVPSDP